MTDLTDNDCAEGVTEETLRAYFDRAISADLRDLFKIENGTNILKVRDGQLEVVDVVGGEIAVREHAPFGLQVHLGNCLCCSQRWGKMEEAASPQVAAAWDETVKAVVSREPTRITEAFVKLRAAQNALYHNRV